MAEILLRFDTEDYLTPESDDALATVLRALARVGARATFPLVAAKLEALRRRGRHELLRELRRHDVGYHSATHSQHPTIAEELAPLGWPDGVARFLAREGAGAALVGEAYDGLACYTQPGANWVPQAFPALRAWGVPAHYSEAWNAYVDLDGRPFRYGGVLHWSAPVAAPKPFLSRLPDCLDEALHLAEEALDGRAPTNVVTHPTELCTTEFWDVVNFGHGHMPPPSAWRPAPLRPARDVVAAAAAFDRYLDGLRAMGYEFLSISDLVRRHPERAAGRRFPVRPLAEALRGAELGYLTSGDVALSAAELFGLLVEAAARTPIPDALPWRHLDGPAEAPATAARGELPPDTVRRAAAWAHRTAAATGAVPSSIPLPGGAAADPGAFLMAVAAALRGEPAVLRPVTLATAARVKPAEALHWDWPVFPPGFAAPGLRRLAVLQCWTLKPAPPAGTPADRAWRPGA